MTHHVLNDITLNTQKGHLRPEEHSKAVGAEVIHPYSSARGISLAYSSNYNSMSGNNMADNGAGIYVHSSLNNSIFGNNVTASSHYGILLSISSVNNIVGNIITASSYYGIYSISSSNNSISGNSIANNVYGMWLSNSTPAYGSSNYNLIYNNNFIDNSKHAHIFDGNGNIWDDGYPSGGNYWSDYTDVDLNNDGMWDHPYVIDANNQDHYPLANQWTKRARRWLGF